MLEVVEVGECIDVSGKPFVVKNQGEVVVEDRLVVVKSREEVLVDVVGIEVVGT